MKTVRILLSVILLSLSVQAFELDTSVDDEIRKNYNPSALENSLPALPKTAPTQSTDNSTTVPKSPPVTTAPKAQIGVKSLQYKTNFDKSTAIRIKKGTKFKVKSNAYLSDTTREGARFNFISLQPVIQRYVTIPAGTVFRAVVVNSHPPQISGNGGLLEIAVDGINFKGNTYYANAKITKANHKKIFINNIKGKRQYWKGVDRQVDKGERFYQKTRRTSRKLANNPIGAIISPIPTVIGIGAYAANLVISPVAAVGSKGGKVSIPAGTEFEIKLLEDVYLER